VEIHSEVRLDWLTPDPDAGERLALVFLNGDPNDVQRARQALETALGRDGMWDELRKVYCINLDGLVALRALARRWESLQSALAELEARDSVFEHYHRDLRWRKLRFARWEREEKARQAQAQQARREEREQRERERAQRQEFAQRAWQTRGLPSLPPDVAAAFSELALLPSAPPDLVDLAFRYFARRAHPDLADQRDETERLRRTERMKHLNRSHEILEAYFARLAARQ
jgi:hypothetical protein